MYQVPMAIWNEIAQSQPLSQPWGTLFRLTPEELPPMLEKLVDKVAEDQGANNSTVLAYRLVAPLLQETVAISEYLEETDRMDLRAALPEVNSVNEAVILASQEYRLSPSEQTKLRLLLERLLTQ